jgi:signal transduction histidine kinase
MQQADGWREPETPDSQIKACGTEPCTRTPFLVEEAPDSFDPFVEDKRWSEPGLMPGRARWIESIAVEGTLEDFPAAYPAVQATPDVSSDLSEDLSSLIHDARNMVSAIDLYCDLLEEPDVLSPSFRHYASELRLAGRASKRLLERLAVLERASRNGSQSFTAPLYGHRRRSVSPAGPAPVLKSPRTSPNTSIGSAGYSLDPDAIPSDRGLSSSRSPGTPPSLARGPRSRGFHAGEPICSLPGELQANRNLLSALVGPGVTVGLSMSGGNHAIPMSGDDLTRVLVNIARNAAEAMHGTGHLQIALQGDADQTIITFTDNGPGIPEAHLENIFNSGYTTHVNLGALQVNTPGAAPASGFQYRPWSARHRGLGLAIVRSIVSAAGGSATATNRLPAAEENAADGPQGTDAALPKSSTAPPAMGAVIRLEFPHLEFPLLDPPLAT